MFIKKSFVYLFNCSFYTVGPVLQPASVRPFVQSALCGSRRVGAVAARRLLPAHYATTVPINSRGSVTFSFEVFVLRRRTPPKRTRSLVPLALNRVRSLGGVNTDGPARFQGIISDPLQFQRRFAGRCEESVRLYRRFFFFTFQRSLRERI